MPPSPSNVLDAANLSAALARGLPAASTSVGELVAIAQKEIGVLQSNVDNDTVMALQTEEQAIPAIAASRTLHSVVQTLRREGDSVPEEHLSLLAFHAAAAYAMHGNFPAARAVLREIPAKDLFASDSRCLAAATLDPGLIGHLLAKSSGGGWLTEALTNLQYFLEQGDSNSVPLLHAHIDSASLKVQAVGDAALLRSVRLALRQCISLSIAKCASESSLSVPRTFIRNLVDSGVYTLLPPQRKLLFEHRISDSTENALLSLPTSTGKTLIAEFCLVSALSIRDGIAVFVAPYIAIGNQVASALEKHLPSDIRVHRLFGGYRPSLLLSLKRSSHVIVATPERLDGLMRAQDVLERLRIVVFDEAHLISNSGRGARIEGLLTRLRLQQLRMADFRILAVSAVLSRTTELQEWLNISNDHVYSDSWRPTARRLALWRADGRLGWLYGTDPLRPATSKSLDALGIRKLPWPHSIVPTDRFAYARSQTPATFANAAYLARFLENEVGGPVLIVCGTKANTRGIARTLALSEAADEDPLDPERRTLIETIDQVAPHLVELSELVRRGIAFHNSTVPVPIRLAIENAVRARRLNYVASTTTLAEGADLPFRSTVINDWLVHDKDGQKPMPPLLFRNIVGRCGRAGEFTEGDTVVIENLLGNIEYTNANTRVTALSSLFSDLPSLTSTITEVLERSAIDEVLATFAAQFLAAIPENPDTENLEREFSRATYASRVAKTKDVDAIFASIRNDILDNSEGVPLAIAASPLQLTPIGRAAQLAGVSPDTARRIVQFLRSTPTRESNATLCTQLAVHLGSVAEQPNRHLREMSLGKNPRLYWKVADLPEIFSQWMAGERPKEIFDKLVGAEKSGAGKEYREAQYDYFIEFSETVILNFLPWMLHACHAFREFGLDWATSVAWRELAGEFENPPLSR